MRACNILKLCEILVLAHSTILNIPTTLTIKKNMNRSLLPKAKTKAMKVLKGNISSCKTNPLSRVKGKVGLLGLGLT